MNRLLERLTEALRSRLRGFLLFSTLVFLALSFGGWYALLVAERSALAWSLLAASIAWGALAAFIARGGPQ